MLKQPSKAFLKKDVRGKSCRIHKKTSVPECLYWCFLVDSAKFERTSFLQNSTGRLLLNITVSIVAKGVLANETVNYDTKALLKSFQIVNLRIIRSKPSYSVQIEENADQENSVFRHYSCSETKAYVLI